MQTLSLSALPRLFPTLHFAQVATHFCTPFYILCDLYFIISHILPDLNRDSFKCAHGLHVTAQSQEAIDLFDETMTLYMSMKADPTPVRSQNKPKITPNSLLVHFAIFRTSKRHTKLMQHLLCR
jgi:hypothetical protein